MNKKSLSRMNKNKIGSLDKATNNGDFEQMRIGEFMGVCFKIWGN